jgi:NADPH:quinone reductase-like Zn-dependent oxidoreductase/SAM-dependent methyltransferase
VTVLANYGLLAELSRDEKTSRVNEVRFSMPLSSVIQLALVRLLESWGITPTAVTGHSSGEVAAAFAAGALDLREAVASTYFRGLVNAEHIEKSTSTGGMMAVGLGVEGVQPYLDALTSGKVVVACVNSPSSVTLSGDMSGIDELESKFAAESIFARKLKVQSAFHSHYMLPLEAKYRAALNQYMRRGSRSFKEGVTYSSPVTGGILDNADLLGPENWVDNMIKPVLFAQSFRSMVATETESGLSQNIDAVVEIGPHSALAGPMRQSLSEPALKKLGIAYGSCLERGKHAVLTMQNLAGFLVQRGYPVDVGMVNFPQGQAGLRALPNLPSYPWNHSTRFWAESRMSQEHRFRPHPPHDLLGLRMPGTSDHSPIWRLILRASELPWVRDHIVQSNIVYPGSGYICMAIEAMKQLHSSGDKAITGYLLRDVEISKAMIIPENADGVEVQLFLEPSSERSLVQDWRQFHVYSAPSQGEEWVESAKGMIAVEFGQKPAGSFALKSTSSLDVARGGSAGAAYPKKMNPRDLFKALHAVGVAHGPSFQNLAEIRMADDKAVTTFKIADSAATMPYNYQQPHVIHPITLDAVFQAAYPTLTPEGRKTVGAAVPRAIRSLYISADISSEAGHQLKEYSALLQYNRQGFDVHAAVVSESAQDGSSSPVIELEGMHFQSVGRAEDEDSQGREKLVLINDWQEAFSLNDPSPLRETLKTSAPSEEKAVAQDLARAAYHFVHDALQQLTEEDIANLEWYHKTFYDWMLLLEKQAANNELAPKSSRWANSSEGVKQMLYDRVAVSSVNGELAVRMGKNLVPIMRKQVAPLELMLEGQLLYKFYQHLLHFTRSTAQAGEIVRAIAAENPRAKILEIGAGTGGCTIPVLTALGGEEGAAVAQFEHYDFTDISAGFFQSARDRLAAWGDMISFSTLDIEQDPEKQGFQLGSYDIIIAAQVLHATKNMNNTMTNVRRLLKDGGKLILVETTRDSPDMHLIFGNVPGWWLSEEPERKYSPNMPLESWERILKGTGFTGLDVNVWDCEDTTHQAMSCILSTAIPAAGKQAFEHEVTLVYGDNPPPTEWIKGLMESIVRTTGVTPTLSDLATLNGAGKVCIFLSGLDGSPQAFDEQSFTAIKSLVTSCKGLLWVTKGSAVDAPTPENALHVGLLRTARVEDLSKRYVSLDLDPARSAWTAASQDAITKVFQTALDFSKESGTFDTEYAERDSKILVPRMHPDTVENEDFYNSDEKEPEMQKFIQPGRSLRMHVDVPGLLDSIIFRDDPDARLPLPEDWVEIEPKAFGLNFRDVMAAMGQLNEKQEMGVECAGVVTRVGPKAAAQGLQVGDRVCALTVHGHFANRARVPWTSVAKIPDHMDYETAASFVIVFVTAYFSLFDAGRAEVGETVLVHAASGGVGQACIILCQWIGLEVFATVSSQEKRDFLKNTYGLADDHIFSSRDPSFAEDVLNATGRKGVDIVINSLAGKLLHESWNVLAPHGRFVEIGKKDIHHNKSLEMEPFRRALSFIHVDVVQLADNKGRVIQRILQEVIRLLETKTIRNISPVVSYPLADVARAFRAMQAGKHIGKLVLIPSADDVVKVSNPTRARS